MVEIPQCRHTNVDKVVPKIALIQPSSAAVFSLLQSSFGKQQEQSLEDYIQLSVMMQYNYRMIISVDNLYNKVENNLGIMGYL